MSNVGRILTLVVKITDDQKSKQIWEAHLHPEEYAHFGFQIDAIVDGNKIEECEKLEDKLYDITGSYE